MDRFAVISGRFFIVVATIIFVAGFISVFYKKTNLVSFSASEFETVQATFGSRGIGVLSPKSTFVTYIKYGYIVNGKNYKGGAVRFGRIESFNENEYVYYNPIFPAVSVYEKFIPIYAIIFFLILGLGILEIRKWVLSNIEP